MRVKKLFKLYILIGLILLIGYSVSLSSINPVREFFIPRQTKYTNHDIKIAGFIDFIRRIFSNGVKREKFLCLGTQIEVIVAVSPDNDTKIDSILKKIKSECDRYESKFSVFNPNSIISKINSSKQYSVDDETKELLIKAKHIAEISNGAFDPTVGPLLKLWGFYSKTKPSKVVSEREIQELMPYIGYKNLSLIDDKNLVIRKDENVKIDLSGIAKGFIVDKIVTILRDNQVSKALVNAGGDMYCLGKAPDGEFWKIGIQHPRVKHAIIGKLNLYNRAIATSGDYENYFFIKDKRYSHIINPFTGYPVSNKPMSVTIIAPDTATADGLATAVMVLGVKKGLELINSLEDIEGVIVSGEERLKVSLSDGLKAGKYKFINELDKNVNF